MERITPKNTPGGPGGGDEWFSWAESQPGVTNIGGQLFRTGSSGKKRSVAPAATPSIDPMAQMMEMFNSMMSGMMNMQSYEPAVDPGPTPEELLQQETEQGLNDFTTLYNQYLDASSTATDYINNVIAKERSDAALMGVDYNVTDEQKKSRIESYFSEIFSSEDWNTMNQLWNDYGASYEGTDPVEFLIQHGAATQKDQEDQATTGAPTTARAAGSLSTGLPEEETLGTSFAVGG